MGCCTESEREDVQAYKDEIARLKRQLEAANRKIANAGHRSEALTKETRESHVREERSRKEAERCKSELTKLRQRYQGMESDLKMSKLRNDCTIDRSKIGAMEAELWEIQSDPDRDRPSKIDQKRRLPRMKLELQRLRSKHESQRQLLENLEEMGDMSEAMRRAAATGDETTVKRLLSRGVDVNVPDDSGYTAFQYSCGQGHEGIARLMIEVGGANVNDPHSKTPPIILAANRCQAGVVDALIDHGANVDVRDALNQTPVLIACEKNRENCVPLVRALLSAGANPNATDSRGNTGLHHSAMNGNHCMAGVLMDHGANNSLKNGDLQTALTIARSRGHFKVVDAIARK